MGVNRLYSAEFENLASLQELACCEPAPGSGKLFKYQSPVDLSRLTNVKRDPSLALDFQYQKQVFEQSIFANSFHLVPKEKLSYLLFEEKHYALIDIHIHIPSEHILRDTNSEFELHFVHEDEDEQKLVVAVLFDTAPDAHVVKNDLRRHIIMEEFLSQGEIFFNPGKYIPQDSEFFHLIGSLTTEPFNGPLLWFIMETIPVANEKLVNRVKQIVPVNNNRHTYPIAQRQIWHN